MWTPAHPSSGNMGLFRPVPRGPPEWGELLYEPRWASERRFKEQVIMNVVFISVLLVMVVFALFPLWSSDDLFGSTVEVVGVSFTFLTLPLLFIALGSLMPFRVYVEGVALPMVPMLKGIRDSEEFVPFERVRRVELAPVNRLQALRNIKLTYVTEEGKEKWVFLPNIDDPLRAFDALRRARPEVLDPLIAVLLEEPNVERSMGLSTVLTARVGWVSGLDVLMLTNLFVLMAYFGALSGPWLDTLDARVVELALVTVGAVTLVAWMHLISRSSFLHLIRRHAKVEGDVITFPRPGPLRLLVRTRGRIPLSQVILARRELHPSRFHHIACLELPDGSHLRTPVGVLEGLAASGGFRGDGGVLLSKRPLVEPESRTFSANILGMVALVFAMLAVNRLMVSLVPYDVGRWLDLFIDASLVMILSFWLCIGAAVLLQATD